MWSQHGICLVKDEDMSLLLPLIPAVVGTVGLALVFRHRYRKKQPVATQLLHVVELEHEIESLESRYKQAHPELSAASAN